MWGFRICKKEEVLPSSGKEIAEERGGDGGNTGGEKVKRFEEE